MSDNGQRTRNGWDWVVGGLLVVAGLVCLAHTAVATTVSVVFLGWLIFAAGLLALTASLFRIGEEGFWAGILAGGVMAALGFVFLRNPDVAAVTLTLVAGAMFLATGVARLVAAVEIRAARVPLALGGAVSVLLGLIILLNLFTASLTFLGLILGIELFVEGVAVLIVGRRPATYARPVRGEPATS